jgi:23S rRNA maturation mini-RNase III
MDKLKCTFSYDNHFLINPIKLNCGHLVCEKCVRRHTLKDCVQSINKPNNVKVSKETQKKIEENLLNILKVLEAEKIEKLNKLKG